MRRLYGPGLVRWRVTAYKMCPKIRYTAVVKEGLSLSLSLFLSLSLSLFLSLSRLAKCLPATATR